jgi:hypothetical protein
MTALCFVVNVFYFPRLGVWPIVAFSSNAGPVLNFFKQLFKISQVFNNYESFTVSTSVKPNAYVTAAYCLIRASTIEESLALPKNPTKLVLGSPNLHATPTR